MSAAISLARDGFGAHLLDAIEEGERRAQAQAMTTSFT